VSALSAVLQMLHQKSFDVPQLFVFGVRVQARIKAVRFVAARDGVKQFKLTF
jgi:hypothetical protein